MTVPSDGAVRSERWNRDGDNPSTIGTSDSFILPTPSSREGFFPTEKSLDDITDVCKDRQQLDIGMYRKYVLSMHESCTYLHMYAGVSFLRSQ